MGISIQMPHTVYMGMSSQSRILVIIPMGTGTAKLAKVIGDRDGENVSERLD
jgi:hypothetical protein